MEINQDIQHRSSFFLESKQKVSLSNSNERDTETTNMSFIGSETDHKIREAAAKTEPQWMSIGATNGIMVWQIDGPNLKQLPKFKHGKFCIEDCYLVLHSHKSRSKSFTTSIINGTTQPTDSNNLKHDLHVWVGSKSSGVIQGIAAYKLVEANAYLGRKATQHHEEQDKESKLFLSYFGNRIEVYEPQLLNHVKNVLNRSKKKKKDSSSKGVQRLMEMLATQDLNDVNLNRSNSNVNNIKETQYTLRSIKRKQSPIHISEKSAEAAPKIFKRPYISKMNTRSATWIYENTKSTTLHSPTNVTSGNEMTSLNYPTFRSPLLKKQSAETLRQSFLHSPTNATSGNEMTILNYPTFRSPLLKKQSAETLRQSYNENDSNSITTLSSNKQPEKIPTLKSVNKHKNKYRSHLKPTIQVADRVKMMRHKRLYAKDVTLPDDNKSYSPRSYNYGHRQISKENSKADANINVRHKINHINDYFEPVLYKLKPFAGAKLIQVARTAYTRTEKSNQIMPKKINRSILDSKQGYLLDTGSHIYIWIGRSSTEYQKKFASSQVENYLHTHADTRALRHQSQSPITFIHEDETNVHFDSFFVDRNDQNDDVVASPCCVKNPGNNVLRYIKACQTPPKKSSSSSTNPDIANRNFTRLRERNKL